MSDERPWEDYADPVGQKTLPATGNVEIRPVTDDGSAEPTVGYAEDMAKGAAGGLGRGTAGLVGTAGNLRHLVRSGLSAAGVSDENINSAAAAARSAGQYLPGVWAFNHAPDSAQVQKVMEDYTGKFYQPKTLPGQYASTVGEFAPAALLPGGGGVAARALNTVVPAVTSETAGQFTKGTAAEPWARGIAGVAGGLVGGKLVTPMAPASPARQQAVNVLEREGIPVTAGERTGSKPLQWFESTAADMPLSAARAQQMKAAQAAAYDRAITARQFDRNELTARGVPPNVNLPDPRVAAAGRESLGDEYTRLSQNPLRSDPQLQRGLQAAQTNYERNVLPSMRTRDVEAIRNDIVDRLVAGQGAMPGAEYQSIRSGLGTNARGVQGTQPHLANSLRGMRTALDEAMARGLPPQEAAAWALNNRRYANMKQVERATVPNAENLSPQAVAQQAKVGRVGQYAAQAGNMDELVRAAATVLKPMPNSGTASRLGWQKLFSVPGLVAAGGAGAALGGLPAAAAAVSPFVAARLAMSRPGQAYLGNQAIPQNARDIIAQTLAQQAISQPSGIARNRQERDAYEQKRKDDLRRAGLL